MSLVQTTQSVVERLSCVRSFESMDFDEALVAHAEWKLKLHLQLYGEIHLDAAAVGRDDQCRLGKWIYSDGMKYANEPVYEELRQHHAHFHHCAAEIVAAAQTGDSIAARAMLASDSPYDVASTSVIDAISSMKQRVEEKTNLIMGHVSVGILVIDRTLVVQSGYSQHCHELLSSRRIAGRHLCELLGLSGTAFEHSEGCLVQAFEDVLPPEVSLAMLPSRVQVGRRTLGLVARAIRSAGEELDYILFTIEDLTHVIALERERAEGLAMMRAARNRHAFTRFLRDARERLAALTAAPLEQPEVRRDVHTIKGNASLFELKEVTELAGRIEEQPSISVADIEQLAQALAATAAHYAAALGVTLDGVSSNAVIDEDALRSYERRCASAPDDVSRAELLRSLLQRLRMRPVRALLGPVEERVALLATKLEKRVDCAVVGDSLLVDEERVARLIGALAHALRNAIDHGIEPSEQRLAQGKPAAGLIELRFSSNADQTLCISLTDDGRGIDGDALLSKAIALGLAPAEARSTWSREQRLSLVLLDGLSTKATATEVSGRGVGMGALRESVQRVQGDMTIESRPGEGTVLQLRIPSAAWAASASYPSPISSAL